MNRDDDGLPDLDHAPIKSQNSCGGTTFLFRATEGKRYRESALHSSTITRATNPKHSFGTRVKSRVL